MPWPAGPCVVELLWAATRAVHRGENQHQAGPVRKFQPTADRKMRTAFIFQIFSKFQTNLNSNQIYNFDDFHSHTKI
jgi:hypothetical protein